MQLSRCANGQRHPWENLSERERQIILDGFVRIAYELQHAIDKHSKKLIVATIELFLDYCMRFYDRHKTVNEIAYEPGFKYPQHFSRVFKQRVGHSPNEYRMLN